jgi:hypothetical protein
LSHSQVLGSVVQTLDAAGFGVKSMAIGVTADGARFFGTLQLQAEIMPGVGLAVGIRNSTDKSLPIGFCCGQWVFVCDNLGFSSEVVITRKHTRFGESRFNEAIAATISGLGQYQESEAKRIEWLRSTELTPDRANSLILRAYEEGIIGARLLPVVIQQWRQPNHPEFRERTAWSLLNAFTEVLKDRQQRQPSRSRPRDDHPAKADRRRVRDARTSRLTDDLGLSRSSTPRPLSGRGSFRGCMSSSRELA